ncbi:MAG TPA: hypothetical protein DDY98_03280 [Ruminococcaceae bacterium]|nr:hypothetical protein [Oscillospiraceae bacterium]
MNMSKRIGIMTFHRALNYGAVLQAFALSYVLNQNGFDAQLLDYHCRGIDDVYRPFHANECSGVVDKVKKLLKSFQLLEKGKGFAAFRRQYLKQSEPIASADELKKAAQAYDVVISGSDQVFDPCIALGDLSYFLDFVPDGVKKLSYAASFGGMTADSAYAPQVAELLKRFEALTLREKSSVSLVRQLCGKTADTVLDPTLLLTKEQWAGMAQPPKKVPQKYVLCYVMWNCHCALDEARRLAKEIGVQVVLLNPTLKQQLNSRDCVQYTSASPQEFLYLIKNAEKVVTTSFHGTAFSAVFEKDFYAETISPKTASRITDLLDLLGLSHRLLPLTEEKPIDWDGVRLALAEERKRSTEKLLKMCGDSAEKP